MEVGFFIAQLQWIFLVVKIMGHNTIQIPINIKQLNLDNLPNTPISYDSHFNGLKPHIINQQFKPFGQMWELFLSSLFFFITSVTKGLCTPNMATLKSVSLHIYWRRYSGAVGFLGGLWIFNNNFFTEHLLKAVSVFSQLLATHVMITVLNNQVNGFCFKRIYEDKDKTKI